MSDRRKVWLSWSSGKDSAWALSVLRQRADVEVVALMSTLTREHGRVSMHGVRRELLAAQADAAGLPLDEVELPWPCDNAQYEAAMTGAVGRARTQGVTAFAFGDLFLEDIRRYREERLSAAGMDALFPLFGRDTAELAREMIAAGVRARITCVDDPQLDRSFLGRVWDLSLLEELPPEVDPCGERGEFHTFVFDGPMLDRPIPVRLGECVTRDGFSYADLLPAGR